MSITVHGILQTLLLLFSLVGLLSLSRLSLSLLRAAHSRFLRRPRDLRSIYGPWAAITGCTDGIGRALAHELAGRGLHLVLVGRSPSKLSALAASLALSFPSVRTKTLVSDFSSSEGGWDPPRIVEEEEEDVGMLVNCAGMGTAHAEYFHERDVDTWMEMVRVNLVAPTLLTKAAVEGMLRRRGRRGGAVVNIGSGSAVAIPSYPLYDVYAATKAYICQFSRCLHHEYKDKGIDVQCQIPMFVDTNLIKNLPGLDRSSMFVASPEAYARAAVRWIGYGAQCVPYLPHFVECCLASIVPDSIQNALMLKENLSQMKPAS